MNQSQKYCMLKNRDKKVVLNSVKEIERKRERENEKKKKKTK